MIETIARTGPIGASEAVLIGAVALALAAMIGPLAEAIARRVGFSAAVSIAALAASVWFALVGAGALAAPVSLDDAGTGALVGWIVASLALLGAVYVKEGQLDPQD